MGNLSRLAIWSEINDENIYYANYHVSVVFYIVKSVKIKTLNVSIHPFQNKLQFSQRIRTVSGRCHTLFKIVATILIKSNSELRDYPEFRPLLGIVLGDRKPFILAHFAC